MQVHVAIQLGNNSGCKSYSVFPFLYLFIELKDIIILTYLWLLSHNENTSKGLVGTKYKF